MPILTQPAFGPKVALAYVTVGALIDVWTGVWFFTRESELTRSQQFWVVGLALTGLTLIVLGLLLGPLGRSARKAELPPEPETRAEAAIQQTAAAAAQPAAVAPVPAAPVMASPPVAVPSPAAPVAPPAPPPGAAYPQPRVS